MLYVSRAPWGIYEILEEFFQRHEIPVGPILFLREWGISWRHPLPRRAVDHKRHPDRGDDGLYDDMPFVLIGDSGQHDPEIYAGIVDRHPGRVRAVYIRDVRGARSRTRRRGRRHGRGAAAHPARISSSPPTAPPSPRTPPASASSPPSPPGGRGARRGAAGGDGVTRTRPSHVTTPELPPARRRSAPPRGQRSRRR